MKEREDTELTHDLQNYYRSLYGNAPDVQGTWQKLTTKLDPQESRVSGWRMFFHRNRNVAPSPVFAYSGKHTRRFVPLLAAALLLLVIGMLVFAGSGFADIGGAPLNDLFKNSILNLQPVQRQFSDYHQSKSVDGYTLTLQKVLADSNRVVVGFTGETPAGGDLTAKFAISECTLKTDQGLDLPGMGGDSSVGQVSGTFMQFDASAIQGTPKDLKLELQIPYGYQSQSDPFMARGFLTFDFVAPFHPGKEFPINKAVTASGTPHVLHFVTIENGQRVQKKAQTLNGKTIILQKVVISASETRVYLSGLSYEEADDINSMLSYTLTTDKATYQWNGTHVDPPSWHVSFDEPELFRKTGTWTLTIQQFTSQADHGFVPVLGASWTFQFTVK